MGEDSDRNQPRDGNWRVLEELFIANTVEEGIRARREVRWQCTSVEGEEEKSQCLCGVARRDRPARRQGEK